MDVIEVMKRRDEIAADLVYRIGQEMARDGSSPTAVEVSRHIPASKWNAIDADRRVGHRDRARVQAARCLWRAIHTESKRLA